MATNRIDFKQHVEETLARMKAERARSRQLMEEEQKEADVSNRVKQEEKAQDIVERQIILESTRAPNVGSVPSLTYNFAGLRATKKRKRENNDSNDEVFLPRSPTRSQSTTSIDRSRSADNDSEEKENSLERHPDAPPPRAPRSNVKQTYTDEEEVITRWRPSAWYLNQNPTKTRKDLKRSDEMAISQNFRSDVRDCIEAEKNGRDPNPHFSKLRTRIHDIEFYRFLDGALIKKSKILEPQGLRQIIDGPDSRIFPYDIRDDADVLYRRWMSGDIDYHLLRGINTERKTAPSGKSRTSDKLDRLYEMRKSANEVGSNGLINGQWWPTRMAVLRDGGHGALEAGIHGQTEKGAYSVVIARSGYGDEDKGETIEYYGTPSTTSTPTHDTTLIRKSYSNNQLLRVFRAENKKSKYAPRRGIRYDGLYRITKEELRHAPTAFYCFSLRRIKGQNPIRYTGAEARPTDQEIDELDGIAELKGLAV